MSADQRRRRVAHTEALRAEFARCFEVLRPFERSPIEVALAMAPLTRGHVRGCAEPRCEGWPCLPVRRSGEPRRT